MKKKSPLWYWKEENDKFKAAYESGKIEGLLKAYCTYYQYPDDIKLEEWVRDGLYDQLTIALDDLKERKTGKRGPRGNQKSVEKLDKIHHRRWKLVKELRDKGFKGDALWNEVESKKAATEDKNKTLYVFIYSEKLVNSALKDPLERGRFIRTMYSSLALRKKAPRNQNNN